MTNKVLEAIEMALKNISSSAKKLIIVPEGVSFPKVKTVTIALQHDFNVEDAIIAIADIKYVGIINAELFSQTKLSELINILTFTNKATVVRLNSNPINCRIFYPEPEMGLKYFEGNYEYRYKQSFWHSMLWEDNEKQKGWGVKVINTTKTDYKSPLTMIQGYPVINMSYLFSENQSNTLNLIDWDTSNVTDMSCMFYRSRATSIDGLSTFDTFKVTNMAHMFQASSVTSLDLSGFDTSNVTNMTYMFARNSTTSLDLSSFDTSNVTNMNWMFDLSSIKSLIARIQSESHDYQACGGFPPNAAVTIKL